MKLLAQLYCHDMSSYVLSAVTGQKTFPLKPEEKEKEYIHHQIALKICGYPNWVFIESAKLDRKEGETPTWKKQNDKRNNIFIPYVAGLSKKHRRIFSKQPKKCSRFLSKLLRLLFQQA